MTGFAGGVFLRRLRATSPKGISSGSSCAVTSSGPSCASSARSSSSRIPENRNMRKADHSHGKRKSQEKSLNNSMDRSEERRGNRETLVTVLRVEAKGARRRNGG